MAKKPEKKTGKKSSYKSSVESLIEYAQKVKSQHDAITKSMLKTYVPTLKAVQAQQRMAEAIINQYNKMVGVIPVSRSEFIEEETASDNLYELKKFIPVELNPTTENYIDKLLDNMGANSDFFNNAVMNLSHFYIFCIHCMLVKAYKHGDRIELLKFLKKTTSHFEKHDIDSNKLQHYTFNKIERDAVKFLFHIIGINTDSHLYSTNKRIFDLRNDIAHFNEQVLGVDRYEEIFADIKSNLAELSKKTYKHTKESLCEEIRSYIKTGSLDDESYIAIFEGINQQYYITYYDYEILTTRLTSRKPKTNYYILKYANEQLGIEQELN